MKDKFIQYLESIKTSKSFVIVLSKNFYFENDMCKIIRENKDIDFLITDFDMKDVEVVFVEKGQFYLDNIINKIKEGD